MPVPGTPSNGVGALSHPGFCTIIYLLTHQLCQKPRFASRSSRVIETPIHAVHLLIQTYTAPIAPRSPPISHNASFPSRNNSSPQLVETITAPTTPPLHLPSKSRKPGSIPLRAPPPPLNSRPHPLRAHHPRPQCLPPQGHHQVRFRAYEPARRARRQDSRHDLQQTQHADPDIDRGRRRHDGRPSDVFGEGRYSAWCKALPPCACTSQQPTYDRLRCYPR